jgi:peptide/nickel transport system substrate-binding protein
MVQCTKVSDSNKSVFYYNEVGSLSSLDPAFARNFENIWATNQIFDGLLEFDTALALKPSLADSFVVSSDGLSYTFYIKQGVLFHSNQEGEKLTLVAEDVAYSLQRLVSADLASPGRWVMNDVASAGDTLDIRYSNAENKVDIRLKKPNASFLYKLAMPYSKVISKQAYLSNPSSFYVQPIGSGPFQFFVWENRVNLILHKNDAYHQTDTKGGRLPYLDAISVSFLKDPNAVFLSALNGKFHLVSGLTGEFRDELMNKRGVLKEEYQKQFELRKVPYLYTEYLGFYSDSASDINPHLGNYKVRQALSMAIDRKKLISQLRGNIGVSEVKGFVPNVLMPNRSTSAAFAFDIKEAKSILNKEIGDAAYGQIELYAASAQSDLCEFVQKSWSELGFSVKVNIQPASALGSNIATGAAPVFRKSWIADYPDAENFFSLFYSPNFSPNGPNYTHYKNTEVDSLYLELCQTIDYYRRQEISTTIDSLVSLEMPLIPLYYGEVTHLLKSEVDNFNSDAMNVLNLKGVKLEKIN